MKNYNLLIAGLILFTACTNETTTEDSTTEPTADSSSMTQVSEEAEEDPLAGLRYTDEGGKWKVNPETQNGMEKVDSLVKAFDGGDFVQLGTDVKSTLSDIISQCTMKGEDHDQYHIVLHASMKESKAMKRGEVETTENLERYLTAYYEYFELPADSLTTH
jgi:hypothetical protein